MSKCSTCQYRAASTNDWKCEYILLVGHSRGCEPGELCTQYVRGDRLQLPKSMNYGTVYDYKLDKYIND